MKRIKTKCMFVICIIFFMIFSGCMEEETISKPTTTPSPTTKPSGEFTSPTRIMSICTDIFDLEIYSKDVSDEPLILPYKVKAKKDIKKIYFNLRGAEFRKPIRKKEVEINGIRENDVNSGEIRLYAGIPFLGEVRYIEIEGEVTPYDGEKQDISGGFFLHIPGDTIDDLGLDNREKQGTLILHGVQIEWWIPKTKIYEGEKFAMVVRATVIESNMWWRKCQISFGVFNREVYVGEDAGYLLPKPSKQIYIDQKPYAGEVHIGILEKNLDPGKSYYASMRSWLEGWKGTPESKIIMAPIEIRVFSK